MFLCLMPYDFRELGSEVSCLHHRSDSLDVGGAVVWDLAQVAGKQVDVWLLYATSPYYSAVEVVIAGAASV